MGVRAQVFSSLELLNNLYREEENPVAEDGLPRCIDATSNGVSSPWSLAIKEAIFRFPG
jgi:hypothetical protein